MWRIRLAPNSKTDDAIRIDPLGIAALLSALDDAEADPKARIIVLEGQPGVFCNGMDLDYLVSQTEDKSEDAPAVDAYADCLSRLNRSPKLVIAAIDGVVEGGGVGFAAAADICLASARSSFGLPELVLGLLPAVVYPALRLRLTAQKARELCLSPPVDARRAQEIGLVDTLVDDLTALEKAVRGTIKHALRLQPAALAELKLLAAEVEGAATFEAALALGTERTSRLFTDPSALANVRAFFAGDKPPWFDRYRPQIKAEQDDE